MEVKEILQSTQERSLLRGGGATRRLYPPFLTMLCIIIGISHELEISSSYLMQVAVLQVSRGAVPSPLSTNQLPMFSTGENSKSGPPPPIIDLLPMESMIHSLEMVMINATNKIDSAQSTLHCYRARLASIGIFTAHKVEGHERNKKINFEKDKQSEPKVAFPPSMYDGNNCNDVALVVQRYVAENISL
jgi:hypothetical protein